MDNEFDTLSPQEEPEEEQSKGLSSGVIRLFAAEYMGLPHQEALDKLTETYDSLTFEDPTDAAKQFAEASDTIHRLHKVIPETNLGYVFGDILKYVLEENHTEEEKLNKIDAGYHDTLEEFYADPKNSKKLQGGRQFERELDAIRLQLRREIISKDTSRMKDLIARGAEAAFSPLAGTLDYLAGTESRQDLRTLVAESTNPEYDDSLLSVGANIVGQITGVVGTSLVNPTAGLGYLGAMLTNQSKEVYDTTLTETKDPELAKSAMLSSVPWNVLGLLGDRVLGGALGKVIKGEKGAIGAIKGALIGGGVEAAQEYGVGEVLAGATSNPAFSATERDLMIAAGAGGIIGGAIGGIAQVSNIDPEKLQELKDKVRNKRVEQQITQQADIRSGGAVTAASPQVDSSYRGLDIFQDMADEVDARAVEEGLLSKGDLVSDSAAVPIAKEKLIYQGVSTKNQTTTWWTDDPVYAKTYAGKDGSVRIAYESDVPSDAFTDVRQSMPETVIPRDEYWKISRALSLGDREKGLPIRNVVKADQFNPNAPLEQLVDATQEATTSEAKAKNKQKNKGAINPEDLHAWPNVEDATSLVFITHIANQMGTKLAVANVLKKGALANFEPPVNDAGMLEGTPKINITRNMFRNVGSLVRVFAHEFAHSIDSAAAIADGRITEPVTNTSYTREFKKLPVFEKFLRVYSDFRRLGLSKDRKAFIKEVDDLDMSWSPYTKQKGEEHSDYRETGSEQFANAMAAILSEPTRVRENYPLVWKTFQQAVDVHPDLKRLLNVVERSKNDPKLLYETFAAIKEEGQKAEAEIVAKTTQKRLDEALKEKKKLPRESVNAFRTAIFGRYTHALDAVVAAIRAGRVTRERGHEMLTMVQDVTDSYVNLYQNVDKYAYATMEKLFNSVDGSRELIQKRLADLMDINHVINDTNATVDDIKANPDKYKLAMKEIAEETGFEKFFTEVENLNGEDLVRAISKTYSKITPEVRAELRQSFIAKPYTDDLKPIQEAVLSLLQDDTFNVRRLMGNLGVDATSADLVLRSFKSTVGERDWPAYETALKEMHQLGHKLIQRTNHAGLLDPKTKDKMIRNVESYATQNVIKYFQKDGRIPASIRKAVGSWDMTGNATTAYVSKVKALMLRAAYQETQNNTMNIIRESTDTPYREIEAKKHYGTKQGKPQVYYESLFDTRAALEKSNPGKSYFITSEEGKLHLYEVDDPHWAKMFGPGQFEALPGMRYLTGVFDAINKLTLTHWAKTLGSIPFRYASIFRDIAREAMLAGSLEINLTNLIGIPMHMSKNLRERRRSRVKQATDLLTKGIIDPFVQDAFDHHGITFSLVREFGLSDEKVSFEHGMYALAGVPIPKEDSISFPDRWNKKGVELIRKIPFVKGNELKTQIDELATKLMAYDIALNELGKGPWEAGRIMRNWAGTPDPTGGGLEMDTVNKIWLFARAHANGTRAFVEMFKDDPKKIAFQYVYRKLIPRLIVSSPVMGPIIGALFGEDQEKVYRKYLDKLPTYTKTAKSVIGLGFMDEDNVFRALGSKINPDEITANWKSVAFTVPMERELVALDQLNAPLFNAIEDLFATGTVSVKKIVEDTVASMGQVFGGNLSIGAQTVLDAGPLIYSNPQDRFRKQGILTQNVAEAGTLAERFTEYMVWALHNNYPAMFGRTQKKYSTEPTSFFDQVARIPQFGSTMRSFISVTNYGDLERYKEGQKELKRIDAEIKMNLGPNTKAILSDLSRYAGMARSMGKEEWRASTSPEVKNRVHVLNSWQARVYTRAMGRMRDAVSKGDIDELNEVRDQLEESCTRTIQRYLPD